MNLGDRLEEIGKRSFKQCTSLQEITIPTAVEVIEVMAFYYCLNLTSVNLGGGLMKIGKKAFGRCKSLRRIVIPPNVTVIHETAFHRCSNLASVVFCDEIEEFVSIKSIRDWWDHGIHEKSLSTYNFFVRCSLPRRLGFVRPMKWRANIHEMLRRIPTISSKKGLKSYYISIDSKLSVYEDLYVADAPMFLELALWKSKITEQFEGGDKKPLVVDMKKQCRIDSLAMISIIIPNVLSFLTDGIESSDAIGSDDDDDGSSNNNDSDNDSYIGESEDWIDGDDNVMLMDNL